MEKNNSKFRNLISHDLGKDYELKDFTDGISMKFTFANIATLKDNLKYLRKTYGPGSVGMLSGLTDDINKFEKNECTGVFVSVMFNFDNDDSDNLSVQFYIETGAGDFSYNSSEVSLDKLEDASTLEYTFLQDAENDPDGQNNITAILSLSTSTGQFEEFQTINIDDYNMTGKWVRCIIGGDSLFLLKANTDEKEKTSTQSSNERQGNSASSRQNAWLIRCDDVQGGDAIDINKWTIKNEKGSPLRYTSMDKLFHLELLTSPTVTKG
jgi:hypothetical protein